MKAAAFAVVLLVPLLLTTSSSAAEDDATQVGSYTGANPWGSAAPDCRLAPGGLSFGLGGACFHVPEGAARFRVTVEDEVFGPGFGVINLCIDTPGASLCEFTPICHGVAEGAVPVGATSASVIVYGPVDSSTFCWIDGLAWIPTKGSITLEFSGGG